MTTLDQRIKERLTALGMTNAQLAQAAGVKEPTSFNWASGKTKSIKSGPLFLAANALGVTPEWLSTGKGQKLINYKYQQNQQDRISLSANEKIVNYKVESDASIKAKMLIDKLPDNLVKEVINYIEWVISKNNI